MPLILRMTAAISSLFLLFLVGIMAIGWILGLGMYPVVLIALGFILLQWWIGPVIIRWIYKIKWVELEYYDQETRDYIHEVVRTNKIKMPKFGIIEEDNPNAFCFGRTRNSAYLVITQGMFKYCDQDEVRAVIGHEMGHIVHNDFVVMTLVAAVPLLFYILARGCMEAIRHTHSSGKNDPRGFLLIVAVISYVIYFVSNLIVMLIARYREYWADQFSAESNGDTTPLITALVKIAYGLATESKSSQENKKKDKHYENALMIFDSKVARNLAFNATSVRNRKGEVTIQDMKEAMAWDMWNPWAKYLELFMTHPLPAKRIIALDKVGEKMEIEPYLDFDLKQPESYWDEFAEDIFAKYSFVIPVVICLALFPIDLIGAIGIMLGGLGFYLFLYLIYYRYPRHFRKTDLESLIDNPKVSPIRGMPVRVQGKIIGRGDPGLIFNEDLKLDDGRSIMLLDYHQISRLIDFFVGLFGTEKYLYEEVELLGWYRRVVTPYIESYRMRLGGRSRNLHTRGVYSSLALGLGVFGGVFLFLSSMILQMFVLLGVLLGVIGGFYSFVIRKYRPEHPIE